MLKMEICMMFSISILHDNHSGCKIHFAGYQFTHYEDLKLKLNIFFETLLK